MIAPTMTRTSAPCVGIDDEPLRVYGAGAMRALHLGLRLVRLHLECAEEQSGIRSVWPETGAPHDWRQFRYGDREVPAWSRSVVMRAVTIHDSRADGPLAFDLIDVLRLVEPDASSWISPRTWPASGCRVPSPLACKPCSTVRIPASR